jgi:hypothetical protein
MTVASDEKSWPNLEQFLFIKQTYQNYIIPWQISSSNCDITVLTNNKATSVLNQQLQYSFLPDYLSFTQAHIFFGLYTGPDNYINLYQWTDSVCMWKKIEWCHLPIPYTYAITCAVPGDTMWNHFPKIFLELLSHCSKVPQVLQNDALWTWFLVTGKGKCYGGCKLKLLHKKTLPRYKFSCEIWVAHSGDHKVYCISGM